MKIKAKCRSATRNPLWASEKSPSFTASAAFVIPFCCTVVCPATGQFVKFSSWPFGSGLVPDDAIAGCTTGSIIHADSF